MEYEIEEILEEEGLSLELIWPEEFNSYLGDGVYSSNLVD